MRKVGCFSFSKYIDNALYKGRIECDHITLAVMRMSTNFFFQKQRAGVERQFVLECDKIENLRLIPLRSYRNDGSWRNFCNHSTGVNELARTLFFLLFHQFLFRDATWPPTTTEYGTTKEIITKSIQPSQQLLLNKKRYLSFTVMY